MRQGKINGCVHPIFYTQEETTEMKKNAAASFSEYGIKNEDKETQLFWAKANANKNPSIAYSIMKEQQYKGPERKNATICFVEDSNDYKKQEYALETIDKEDLQSVVDGLLLDSQVWVAKAIDNKARMQEFQMKRDTTFDFMRIGEELECEEYDEYYDRLP